MTFALHPRDPLEVLPLVRLAFAPLIAAAITKKQDKYGHAGPYRARRVRLMPTAWRIVTARFVAMALSGEGARLYGGRWNPKGVPLVYTAGSQALVVLEILVQDEPLHARYVVIPAYIPDDLTIEQVWIDQLPPDWRSPQARGELQKLGAAWMQRGISAVLAVPSAVIPAETNYLLNPVHPNFARIKIGQPQELVIDLRLLKRVSA